MIEKTKAPERSNEAQTARCRLGSSDTDGSNVTFDTVYNSPVQVTTSTNNDDNDGSTMTFDIVFIELMDAIKTSRDLSITRAKSEELNAKIQTDISRELSSTAIKTIPDSCYETYAIYKWIPAHWAKGSDGRLIKIEGHNHRVGTGVRLKDLDTFNKITTDNRQQVNIQQNCQNSISLMQQQSQLDITGADNAAKTSTQEIGAQRSTLDVLLSITTKMAKKR